MISYRNGTVKEIAPDNSLFIRFVNGDSKRQIPVASSSVAAKEAVRRQAKVLAGRRLGAGGQLVGGVDYEHSFLHSCSSSSSSKEGASATIVVYYYQKAQTVHTTFPDGLEVYEFPNGQMEQHFPNGEKLIMFADGTTKTIYNSGVQESVFPDGIVVTERPDGQKEVRS